LGERLLCKQEVIGSIPFTSTAQKSDSGSEDRAADNRQRSAPEIGVLS
jgi:hypothetical protein